MSTKLNPGPRDCLAKAEPDEPYFVLLGRDKASPVSIRIWCHIWLQEINLGMRPESDRPQITEALNVAYEMEKWCDNRAVRLSVAAAEMDAEGRPTKGEHRQRERNSTSGANDG
jgi:hypothetical protein